MTGAMTPNTLFAVAVSEFPVPLCFVGKSSGVMAYKTPYIILLVKLYAQFHPRRLFELRAVVDARMKMPVKIVKIDRVPLRPSSVISTMYPASREPGIAQVAKMTWLR